MMRHPARGDLTCSLLRAHWGRRTWLRRGRCYPEGREACGLGLGLGRLRGSLCRRRRRRRLRGHEPLLKHLSLCMRSRISRIAESMLR